MSPRVLCRVIVFALRPSLEARQGDARPPVPRRARGRQPALRCVAWHDWHASRRDEIRDARLAGAGSFYWASPRAAWRRARVLIARNPLIQSIRVETISGRRVGTHHRRYAYAHSAGCE